MMFILRKNGPIKSTDKLVTTPVPDKNADGELETHDAPSFPPRVIKTHLIPPFYRASKCHTGIVKHAGSAHFDQRSFGNVQDLGWIPHVQVDKRRQHPVICVPRRKEQTKCSFVQSVRYGARRMRLEASATVRTEDTASFLPIEVRS